MATALVWAALVLAALTSAYFAFVPTETEKDGPLVTNSEGVVERRLDKETLGEAHGKGVLLFLLVPIALCAVPLVRRTTVAATAAGAALAGLALITAFFTVGAYFMPSALIVLIAAALVEFGVVEGDYE